MKLAWLLFSTFPIVAQWPQYGGPEGNFVSKTAVASTWPQSGPKQLWTRPLGEGYSGVTIDSGILYTMYRNTNEEVIVALDNASGKTKWELAYESSRSGLALENGPGPHSTPLVLGDRVFTIGIRGRMHALDKKTGKLAWSKELFTSFPGSSEADRGYSVSPVAYKNTILVKLGGPNHAIVALNPKDGSLLWQSESWVNAPATPIVVQIGGKDVLLTQFSEEVVSLTRNGKVLWTHPHKTDWGLNITPPLYGPDRIVVVTSAYSGGARGIQLDANGTNPQELWKHNRLRVHFTTALRIDGHVYGSSGDFGPSPLTCVEVKSGRVVWQDRTFSKANLVQAGNKTILLDEDGVLGLVTLAPEGLKVHSKSQVASSNAWTAPSLAGTILYVRDRKNIAAFDLK
ncbi:MAG: PQQ-binding-like beta-propeller repeat protein [Bryobacteraceae bacterium]